MTRLLLSSSYFFRKGGIRTAASYFYGLLVVLCWTTATKSSTITIPTTHGFCLLAFSSPPSSRSTKSRVLATIEDATDITATSSTASTVSYSVEVMTGGEQDPRVVDVATFRNRLRNPQMMVERAQQKREAIDPTSAALDGLKIGCVYLGPLIAAGTYFTTNTESGSAAALTNAVTNYGKSRTTPTRRVETNANNSSFQYNKGFDESKYGLSYGTRYSSSFYVCVIHSSLYNMSAPSDSFYFENKGCLVVPWGPS